jgi:hypothetical protein
MDSRQINTTNKKRNQIQVIVKTIKHSDIKLIVSPGDTVDQLKQLVFQKTSVKVDDQVLNYAGKPMLNGLKICQFQIRNMSTVLLLTQVNGG